MRRHLLPIVLAGVVLAGCSSSGDDPQVGSGTSTSAAVSPTATATPADPFAIPAVIDATYVNRVLAELYRIDGDVVRKVIATGSLDPTDIVPLRSIYNDPQFELQARGLPRVLAERDSFLSPPGDRNVTVRRIERADGQCIVAEAQSDFSRVLKAPPVDDPGEATVIALRPTQSGADAGDLNVTPWSIQHAEIVDADEVTDPCS